MAVGLGLEANVKLNSDLSVNTGPYRNIVKQSSRSKPLNDFKVYLDGISIFLCGSDINGRHYYRIYFNIGLIEGNNSIKFFFLLSEIPKLTEHNLYINDHWKILHKLFFVRIGILRRPSLH